MARHHRRLRCWISTFGVGLACWLASAADPLPQQVEHPFRNLAAWLREASPDLRSADPKAISRGITVLSNSQSYVKSFDGMAYELKGKLRDGANTDDIKALRQDAELYESATSAKKAGKLVKLLIEVEKALNAAEAAEIASQFDPDVSARYMKDAGLRFLPTPPPPQAENATANNATSEVVGVDSGIENPVTATSEGTSSVPSTSDVGASPSAKRQEKKSNKASRKAGTDTRSSRRSKGGDGNGDGGSQQGEQPGGQAVRGSKKNGRGGFPSGSVSDEGPVEAFVARVGGCDVQCLLMVDASEERLVVAVGDALSGEALMESLIEEPAVVQLASHGLMRETAYVNHAAFQCACDMLEWAGPLIKVSLEAGGPFEGYGVHCAGHSFGGAVAACLAGLLDGAIDPEAEEIERDGARGAEGARRRALRDRDSKDGGGARSVSSESSDDEGAVRMEGAAPWVGVCGDKVTCVTLGCPPCLSRNLRLPFVTSFVLGDDMVPRTSNESLRRLKRRLLQVMPKGKGLLSQGMAFGTSLVTDVAGVAMQGVRQATTLEDDARLTVPGNVWFAKPRRLKNGATLARVMQGNLKEDMLWQLHDIMLTKSMLSHHRLDKYIQILDRV